jgi:hypothetical protein
MYLDIGRLNWLRITPDNCLAPYLGVKPPKASMLLASSLMEKPMPILSNDSIKLFNCISNILTTFSSAIGLNGTISEFTRHYLH